MSVDLSKCTCGYRHATDGCADWTCPAHGPENRARSVAKRKACPIHTADERGNIVRREVTPACGDCSKCIAGRPCESSWSS